METRVSWFIWVNDIWWEGKGKFVVSYLFSQGWKIISYLPRAVLLQKPSSFTLPKYNKLVFWIQFIRYRYIRKWINLLTNKQ